MTCGQGELNADLDFERRSGFVHETDGPSLELNVSPGYCQAKAAAMLWVASAVACDEGLEYRLPDILGYGITRV